MATVGARPTGERLRRITGSPHYTAGAFTNPVPTAAIRPGCSARVLAAQLTSLRARRPRHPIPVHRLTGDQLAVPPASGLRVTWLGHASVLAELGTRRILFDPVWGRRCSPVGFVGPARLHPAPIEPHQLPDIDVVAISHDHYDHLDMSAIKTLAATTTARFVVPLGIGAHLHHWGVPDNRIVELDWHDTTHLAALSITATPARHHSGRGLRREPAILWCSWTVTDGATRIFHGGDSGYFPALADIGTTYGPFDLTMIGIGAYHQLWPDVHMTPEQAVTAHHDLHGHALLPIHWATYPLAPHPWAEPIDRALAAASRTGTRLLAPIPGQPVDDLAAHQLTRWWNPPVPAPGRLRAAATWPRPRGRSTRRHHQPEPALPAAASEQPH